MLLYILDINEKNVKRYKIFKGVDQKCPMILK